MIKCLFFWFPFRPLKNVTLLCPREVFSFFNLCFSWYHNMEMAALM